MCLELPCMYQIFNSLEPAFAKHSTLGTGLATVSTGEINALSGHAQPHNPVAFNRLTKLVGDLIWNHFKSGVSTAEPSQCAVTAGYTSGVGNDIQGIAKIVVRVRANFCNPGRRGIVEYGLCTVRLDQTKVAR